MATKYVRDSYRDHAKGVVRELPPVQRPAPSILGGRWTFPQTMVLLVVVCLLFIVDALVKRQQFVQNDPLTGQAIVQSKHTTGADTPKLHYVLDLDMTLMDGNRVAVVAECTKDLWEHVREGDAVTVNYFRTDQDDRILIQEIKPGYFPAGSSDRSASDSTPIPG